MTNLQRLLANGSDSPRRLVTVSHEEWEAALEAAQTPAKASARRQLAELLTAATQTRGTTVVSIQANHLKLVLELQPPPSPSAPDADPESAG